MTSVEMETGDTFSVVDVASAMEKLAMRKWLA